MLPPNYFDDIEKDIIHIYNSLELEIIEEIAQRISKVGYANTVVKNDVRIAQEMGMLYQDIVNIVAKYNNTSYEEILNVFEKAGIKSIKIDDRVYKEAGLNPLPFNQSNTLLKYLIASAEKTNRNFNNLVMTTANTSQVDFINAMNKAYMEVSTGVKSYSQSIMDAISEISGKGTIVEYPSGYRTTLESATRMNIITGINQTCGKMQLIRAKEMGCDLMEISAHSGARPEHANWQGKIVSLSGKKGYLSLKDIGYGEVDGFKGINCRHDWLPYYEGTQRTYSEELLKEYYDSSVNYNGKKMSSYEASQLQRKMEKTIRNDKKRIVAYNGILKSENADNELIEETKMRFSKQTLILNEHQKILNDFIEQVNSRNDISRTFIGNYERTISKQTKNIKNIANRYNKNIIGKEVNGIKINEVGEHIISRTYTRNVSYDDIEDTLKNPIKYGKIREDNSQRIRGSNCTIVINVKTGKLVTVYPKKEK